MLPLEIDTHTVLPHPTKMKTGFCTVPQNPLALCTKNICTFREATSRCYLAFSTLSNTNSTFSRHFDLLSHYLVHFFSIPSQILADFFQLY